MLNQDPLVFALELEERPVSIAGEPYVLIELDGRDRDKYLNSLGSRVKTAPNGKSAGIKNFDGLQATLIVMSLRKIEGDERNPVKLETIQKWPARVVTALFNAARDLSALNEDDEDDDKAEEEGND